MATIDKRPLKAYVRFDGTGRIVPSSLILRRKKPKVGKWVEIPAYESCNDTTTSTTTAAPECLSYAFTIPDGGIGGITGINCSGEEFTDSDIPGPASGTVCAFSVSGIGDIELTLEGPCTLE